MSFVHLHVHTQYSILDGLSNIKKLFQRARELEMPAVAITDHGNMYGVKEFFKYAFDKKSGNLDENGNPIVKPIVGCEVYVTRHFPHTEKKKGYYHLILLAKNYDGYKNLMKIVSLGHIEGMYYRPRIDHDILEKYHENLICCSACLMGEVPQDILSGDLEAADKAIEWHKKVFGDDYYLEVMLHRSEVPDLPVSAQEDMQDLYRKQKAYTEEIFRLAEKHSVKVVATNDAHFIRKEDGPTHDRLICLTTNSNISDEKRLRYTQQEYLKSEAEMAALFPDHPEVISNTVEVAGKVEVYKIDRPHVLPKFNIDPEFLDAIDSYFDKYKDVIDEGRCDKDGNYRGDEFCKSVAFLSHLTYEGAHRRYGETLSREQIERIDFELKTISKMGFPDYFLIVQDYISASRKMGYMVGPGRGSAAGSVVAYCLGITNLDPLKYSLLFERFLNPDRVSMPDIDVDFENLTAAHEYVERTYGKDHVSRVITYGTMAAKSAIKDVARISQLSIDESNRLSAMVPDHLSDDDNKDVAINLSNCFKYSPDFRNELKNGTSLNREVLEYAEKLEGSIRQVGQHACATIIGRGNLTDYIPICLSKDKETGLDVWTSQYDGHYIEDVGMLKMDFLGLNTLSIIHKTLDYIKQSEGIDIDIEAIPNDDPETFRLYGRGDTTIVFQFESEGMKKWLQKLHPERFEDLIAMNALYRPGPMDYIPDFVDRKLGIKPIEYDLADMEEFLKDTYGITVYQEQVMLLSQKLAGFTKGQADTLRKAMGKKQIETLNSLKGKFMAGGAANGHPADVLDKIWKDWEKFAQYAFNKSHATCYAWVSYQTGWLKCHYPAEFFAANLTCNLDKGDEIKKIMADCKAHGIKILSPDVNESAEHFTVVRHGSDKVIRFGLGGMKGFGTNVVNAIISERESRGAFKNPVDFIERMSGAVNRKSLETLVYADAFASFGCKRAQFFALCKGGGMYIDELYHYGECFRNDTLDGASSLFGDDEDIKLKCADIPELGSDAEDDLEMLQKEKEIVGMFLSAHPLDKYSFEIRNFTNCQLAELGARITEADEKKRPCKVYMAGMVSGRETTTARSGKQGLIVNLDDYSGKYELRLWGKNCEKFSPLLELRSMVYLEGEIRERFRPKSEDGKPAPPAPYDFNLTGVSLLGDVAESFLNAFVIYVDSSVLNRNFTSSLVKLIKRNKGKVPLSVNLSDAATGYRNLEFRSRKYAVSITNELLAGLSSLGLNYAASRKPGK